MKQTRVIATIGPASESPETLQKIYRAGANIARINCSHFEHDEFVRKVSTIHNLNNAGDINMGIMLDTKGPEIRTCLMDEPLTVQPGDSVIVTTSKYAHLFEKRVVSDYVYSVSDAKIGGLIDIDCGLLSLTIQEKHDNHLICQAQHTYTIKNRRHINFPGIALQLPGLTDQDKEHIALGVEYNIHYVAMSFVRSVDHIREYRSYIQSLGVSHLPVIAKIETSESVDNIDEILHEVDGIMVARGDLGAQIPMVSLPATQETLIKKARAAGKIVIVATNMLESMIEYPTPTRAELTDVYTAVKQGADATMLSGETAIGKFPIESVNTMSNIISHAEGLTHRSHNDHSTHLGIDEDKKSVIRSALMLADSSQAKALVVFTNSGFMARTTAGLRPNQPVYAFTFSDTIAKKLTMCYGIRPVVIQKTDNDQQLEQALSHITGQDNNIGKGDKVVILIDGKASEVAAPECKLITL